MNQDLREMVLKEKLLPAFQESTRRAFETMAFVATTFGEPVFNQAQTPLGDVSGTIGVSGSVALTGDTLCGNLSLVFTESIAQAIFRSMMMMGKDDPVSQQEIVDAVGELANMSAGGAKAAMQDIGINFLISLPSVVIGHNHCLSRSANSVTVLIPMIITQGTFYMEMNFSWR
jgi:chemotaxis protein CheX